MSNNIDKIKENTTLIVNETSSKISEHPYLFIGSIVVIVSLITICFLSSSNPTIGAKFSIEDLSIIFQELLEEAIENNNGELIKRYNSILYQFYRFLARSDLHDKTNIENIIEILRYIIENSGRGG